MSKTLCDFKDDSETSSDTSEPSTSMQVTRNKRKASMKLESPRKKTKSDCKGDSPVARGTKRKSSAETESPKKRQRGQDSSPSPSIQNLYLSSWTLSSSTQDSSSSSRTTSSSTQDSSSSSRTSSSSTQDSSSSSRTSSSSTQDSSSSSRTSSSSTQDSSSSSRTSSSSTQDSSSSSRTTSSSTQDSSSSSRTSSSSTQDSSSSSRTSSSSTQDSSLSSWIPSPSTQDSSMSSRTPSPSIQDSSMSSRTSSSSTQDSSMSSRTPSPSTQDSSMSSRTSSSSTQDSSLSSWIPSPSTQDSSMSSRTSSSSTQDSSTSSKTPSPSTQDNRSTSYLLPDRDLEAKYLQTNKLGEGGFGSVYAGYRKMDNLPVAIKHIAKLYVRTQPVVIQGETYMIPNEVLLMLSAAGGPDSAGKSAVVTLLDWYDLDQEVVLVMERPVPSVDLFDYMIQAGPLDENQIKNIIKQLLEAAIAMHSEGVFHRDIKAENLLIETGSNVPRVRIIDFGCGCFVSTEPYFRFAGTPAFAPPEYFTQGSYEAAPTTVWQLGTLLYGLLDTDNEFTPMEYLHKMKTWDSGMDEEDLNMTEDCKDFLRKCLIVEPEKRATLEELQRHPWLT